MVTMFTIRISCASGSGLSKEVDASMTVSQLKSAVAEEVQCPPERQRLVYKGRILDDGRTLESYSVEENSTIFLVRSQAASTRPAPAPAPAPRACLL